MNNWQEGANKLIMFYRHILIYIFFAMLFFVPFSVNNSVSAQNDTATTSVNVIIVCGDGNLSPEEICDKGNPLAIPPKAAVFGTSTCSDFEWSAGNYYNSGYLICSDDCSQILTSMCSFCGNAVKEGLEECDGADFGGATCRTYGFSKGSLSCTGSCKLNLTDCVSDDVGIGGTAGGNAGRGGGSSGSDTGYNPGSETPIQETKIVVQGKAYPNAEVHILLDGKIIGIAKANAAADFNFETKDITPGIASLGFWSEDAKKNKSTTVTLTFRIISSAVTTLSGAFLSPTIVADKTKAAKGEKIIFSGQTIPEADVILNIAGGKEYNERSTSTASGDWSVNYDTNQLDNNGQYLAKSMFELINSTNNIRSGYSKSISFFLGSEETQKKCAGADLNADKRVNLTDFSILLYYWGTANTCADQNTDGKVNLTDFSIMMYNWTG